MSTEDYTTTDEPNRIATTEPVELRTTGIGYEYVSEDAPGRGERPVYVHRLAAVAWGLLDGLGDGDHVHHTVPETWLDDVDTRDAGIPWLTTEDTLSAEPPADHARHHIGGRR